MAFVVAQQCCRTKLKQKCHGYQRIRNPFAQKFWRESKFACHSRAQNIGAKAAEMLRLIPSLTVQIIERCSGHGGTWGMMQDHFQTAIKVGKPTAKQALTYDNPLVLSECPLAAKHILQGMGLQSENTDRCYSTMHPIELLAQAYFR
jgi:glycerol-3-phosphate dehydrogenase subunit C